MGYRVPRILYQFMSDFIFIVISIFKIYLPGKYSNSFCRFMKGSKFKFNRLISDSIVKHTWFGNWCSNSLKNYFFCLVFWWHFHIWYMMIAWKILWLQIHLNKDCILFCWKHAFTFDDTSFVIVCFMKGSMVCILKYLKARILISISFFKGLNFLSSKKSKSNTYVYNKIRREKYQWNCIYIKVWIN